MRFKKFLPILALVAAAWLDLQVCCAQDMKNLAGMGIEDLMGIEVTSVSRSEKKISDSAAAISVITSEDIKRSGATSLAEALRLVPGLEVARVNSTTYAISSRGFNEITANKLLVMIDGRTVYTPIFSGVFWSSQDVVLADIERIEVIRGPGGTLWGANAVNGVINIITKNSKDTLGSRVRIGVGSDVRGMASVRQGAKLGQNGSFRIYAKAQSYDNGATLEGNPAAYDGWHNALGGVRADIRLDQSNSLTFQSDIFGNREKINGNIPSPLPPYNQVVRQGNSESGGGNFLTRWASNFSDGSELSTQLYFDRVLRHFVASDFQTNTWDLDTQYHFDLGRSNSLTVGGGFRWISDVVHSDQTQTIVFDPNSKDYQIGSTFIQDEIALVPKLLTLTLGTKFEHNDFSGAEWQPNVRMIWTPQKYFSLWGAVSRAVRTPSRIDQALSADLVGFEGPQGIPGVARVVGNPNFDSEGLLAYELGQRYQIDDSLFIDIATFIDDYKNGSVLVSGEPYLDRSRGYPLLVQPNSIMNVADGQVYGVETSIDWKPLNWLSFVAAHTYLDSDINIDPSIPNLGASFTEGNNPHNQFSLRGVLKLPHQLELDLTGRYVGKLSQTTVKDYFELDLRLGWLVTKDLEVSLAGRNLLHDSHREFPGGRLFGFETEAKRSVFGSVTWNFK